MTRSWPNCWTRGPFPPLDIRWDEAWSPGLKETRLDVQHDRSYGGSGEGRPVLIPADQVRIHVPYSGDRMLLRLQPSIFRMTSPSAQIAPSELVHTVTGPSLTPEQIAADFNRWRSEIEFYATSANSDVHTHNAQLEQQLRVLIAQRRQRLLNQRNLTARLPFQVRPASSAATYPLPVRRTKVHLTQPRASKPFQPEPALEEAFYEDVLTRIVSFARMVERAPDSAGAMNEEGLRDHLLLVLNGSYEGQAAGEVFNREGKTDILVRSGDRNVFIGECKIWTGSAKFTTAVDQLLRYLVWRDGKAALVLFIKNADPSAVVQRADAAVAAHPSCERRFDPADPSRRIDYLLRSTADPARTVRTALLPVAVTPRVRRGG